MSAAHPWLPSSPCGDGCLPPPGAVPSVSRVRRLWRLCAVVRVLLGGIVVALVLPLLSAAGRERALRAWFARMLAALGIRVELVGGNRFAAPGAPVLVVSNHISWLDLIALGAVCPLRMVAKSEVGSWPLVGMLSRRAGTIFVYRERLSLLPASVAAAADALRGGGAVGVFPEGTTWCGISGGRFRPAFFQAAVDTGAPVRPVALRYRIEGAGGTTVAAFIGSTTLWTAVLRLVAVRGLVVELRLLALLSPDGTDRHRLAARAGEAVTRAVAPAVAPGVASAGSAGVSKTGSGSAGVTRGRTVATAARTVSGTPR